MLFITKIFVLPLRKHLVDILSVVEDVVQVRPVQQPIYQQHRAAIYTDRAQIYNDLRKVKLFDQ